MAKISLRAYDREIENLIDRGDFDQAISHCRHILRFYPKHLQTYRMLGKSFLESQRYGDAADILQRVLSSVPDDFVAHVGMSIIREDEGNLNEAIWHMERAFEVQPANSAIQSELRRLYGKRDGLEPPKIRLTRAALARMYIKGELAEQAISEIRADMAEHKDRADLVVLLARASYQAGKHVEAAEACTRLLKKLPNCYEANRILALILAHSERVEEAVAYQQRLQALEPYAAHTSSIAPEIDQVPDAAVMLQRLDWQPGQLTAEEAAQPDWAASLGIQVDEVDKDEESLPDWLTEVAEEAKPEKPAPIEGIRLDGPPVYPQTAILAEDDEEIEPTEDQIPDWLKEAGWVAAKGETTAQKEPVDWDTIEEDLEEEVEPGEIPDWLRGMAPEGEPMQELEDESRNVPWLQESPSKTTDTLTNWLSEKGELPESPPGAEQEASDDFELPEWLEELETPQAEQAGDEIESATPLAPEADVLPPASEEEREQAAVVEELMPEPAVEPEGELPEWLREVEAGESAPLPDSPLDQVELEEAALGEVDETYAEDVELEPEIAGETPASAPILAASEEHSSEGEPLDDEESFAWLESLAEKQGADEALLVPAEERRDSPPDWVRDLTEAPPEGEEVEPETQLEEPESTLATEAEIPDWLQTAELESDDETGETPVESELPDWLRETEEYSQGEALHIEEPPISEEDTQPSRATLSRMTGEAEIEGQPAEPLEEPEPSQPVDEFEASKEEELPDWLKTLEEPVTPEEVPQPEDEAVSELEAMPEEEPALEPEAEATPLDDEDAFAWLETLAIKQGADEAILLSPEEHREEPPEWVLEALEEGEEQIEPAETRELTAAEEKEALPEIGLEMEEELEEEEALPPEPESVETLTDQVAEEAPPELPSWLADVEQPDRREDELPWIPPEEDVVTAGLVEAAVPADMLTPADETTRVEESGMPYTEAEVVTPLESQVVNINEAGLNTLESLPGVGFVRAQAILEYRGQHGPFKNVDDLIQVPGVGPVTFEGLKDLLTVGVPPETDVQPLADEEQIVLIQARNALIQSDRTTALEHYLSLIKSSTLLPEVIRDLNEALYRFPIDIDIWQAFGDAYMRSGQLQEALNAYTKAEELLR